jgi:hypothetical protein
VAGTPQQLIANYCRCPRIPPPPPISPPGGESPSWSMIGKELVMIGGKAGFRFPTWKKQGKSWLPITMIMNFGNVISSPVRIHIYNYMYRKRLHSYSRSIWRFTAHHAYFALSVLILKLVIIGIFCIHVLLLSENAWLISCHYFFGDPVAGDPVGLQ